MYKVDGGSVTEAAILGVARRGRRKTLGIVTFHQFESGLTQRTGACHRPAALKNSD